MRKEEKRDKVAYYCGKTTCSKCVLNTGNWKHLCGSKCLYIDEADEDELDRALQLIERGETVRTMIHFTDGTTFKPDGDAVHHPAHYCYSKYEPKDVIRGWGLNFNLGSAVKYISRAGRKDDIIQDLEKAKQFIDFEIEAIENERKAGL